MRPHQATRACRINNKFLCLERVFFHLPLLIAQMRDIKDLFRPNLCERCGVTLGGLLRMHTHPQLIRLLKQE